MEGVLHTAAVTSLAVSADGAAVYSGTGAVQPCWQVHEWLEQLHPVPC
jgi:hypothetical protein